MFNISIGSNDIVPEQTTQRSPVTSLNTHIGHDRFLLNPSAVGEIFMDIAENNQFTLQICSATQERFEINLGDSGARARVEVDVSFATDPQATDWGIVSFNESVHDFTTLKFTNPRKLNSDDAFEFSPKFFISDPESHVLLPDEAGVGNTDAGNGNIVKLRMKGHSATFTTGFSFECIQVALTSVRSAGLANANISLVKGSVSIGYYFQDMQASTRNTVNGFAKLVDHVPPVINNCPSTPIVVDSVPGQNYGLAMWPVINATDNIGVVGLPSQSMASGDHFPINYAASPNTTVWISARDKYGNTGNCSFAVIVRDVEPPVVACPSDQTLPTSKSLSYTIFNLAPSFTSVSDNHMINNASYSADPSGYPRSGAYNFPVGTTVVTLNISDMSDNVASCSFAVTVVDIEPPTFANCPTVGYSIPAVTSDGAAFSFSYPLPSDNHGLNASLLYKSHEPGAFFPIGTTDVVYSATDVSGNIAWCNFSVAVLSSSSTSPLTPSSGSSTSGIDTTTVGSSIGGALFALALVGFFIYRRLSRKKPHNFEELMRQLESIPGINTDGNGPNKPREFRRQCVKVIDKLGAGNFGEVCKGLYKRVEFLFF